MKKIHGEEIWGESNFMGFEMGCGDIKVKTTNFGFKGFAKKLVAIIGLYLAISSAASLFVSEKTLIALGIAYLICAVCFFEKESRQWHSAEHKTINLLESIENIHEFTMENLIKSSSNNQRCSSKNGRLKNPSRKKLKKALEAGREYLEKKKFLESLSFFVHKFWRNFC